MNLALMMHNIRSCYNVGATLRTAEGFGVFAVIFSGYTPRVHDEDLLPHQRAKLDREIHKTALGAEDMVVTFGFDDAAVGVESLKSMGWQVVGLENNIEGVRLYNLNSPKLKKKLGDKVLLILGEEVGGIPEALRPLIDFFVQIPMEGQKESFNVSVAAGIAVYALKNAS